MILFFDRFSGEIPRRSARLLPQDAAKLAENTDLRSGELRAFADLGAAVALPKAGTPNTIYRFADSFWLHWTDSEAPDGVDVSRGVVEGDTSEHTFFCDGVAPRVTWSPIATQGGDGEYPSVSYLLGVPAPTVAPTVTETVVGAGDDPVSRSWAYTWVATWGGSRKVEGPPSPASSVLDVPDDSEVTVSWSEATPAGRNITHIRVYRLVSSDAGSRFYFVAEVPVASTNYVDTLEDVVANGEIDSTRYNPPPGGLRGIRALPNGAMVGYEGNRLYIAEPYLPHAWPDRDLATKDPIVGIGVSGTAVVVATEGLPYVFQGQDPSSYAGRRLKANQACVSRRSVVELGDMGVGYASPDGFILAGSDGVRNLMEQWFSRREWQALNPSSIHAYYWDGRLVFFYDNGAAQGGYMWDPSEGEGALYRIDVYADHAHYDFGTDTLYLLVGGSVQAWAGHAANLRTYRWRSREWLTDRPLVFTAGQVFAASYSDLTLRVYADGVLRHAQSVTGLEPFRLPGESLGRVWEVEVEGTDPVYSAAIAETVAELGMR